MINFIHSLEPTVVALHFQTVIVLVISTVAVLMVISTVVEVPKLVVAKYLDMVIVVAVQPGVALH